MIVFLTEEQPPERPRFSLLGSPDRRLWPMEAPLSDSRTLCLQSGRRRTRQLSALLRQGVRRVVTCPAAEGEARRAGFMLYEVRTARRRAAGPMALALLRREGAAVGNAGVRLTGRFDRDVDAAVRWLLPRVRYLDVACGGEAERLRTRLYEEHGLALALPVGTPYVEVVFGRAVGRTAAQSGLLGRIDLSDGAENTDSGDWQGAVMRLPQDVERCLAADIDREQVAAMLIENGRWMPNEGEIGPFFCEKRGGLLLDRG